MNNQDTHNKQQITVSSAVGYLLRPLIRILLSNGISFQTFCELAKSAYVKVADEEFKLSDKPQTDSRISLLTGIHRREVNRLRNEAAADIQLAENTSMSALLLSIWCGNPDYLDQDGAPRPLPRLSSRDAAPSFEHMVRSVSKDFRPRVVLDEWLRQGIVSLDSEDRVHLTENAFAQPQDIEEKLFYFGQNLHDHAAAIAHNLDGSQPPFLERCVFYDQLSAESCAELAEYSRKAGMIAIHSFNKRAAALQRRDKGHQEARHRVNFGVYHFSEQEAPDENNADN